MRVSERALGIAWAGAGALFVWAAIGADLLWPAVAGYALVAILLSRVGRATPRVRSATSLLLLVAGLVALRAGVEAWPRLREAEGALGLGHALSSRLELERTPSIAPPLVASDRPGVHYVHAPGAASAALRLGPSGPRVEGVLLGHGLFRVDYDPERDGRPDPPDGPLEVTIFTDRGEYRRGLEAAAPLHQPRSLSLDPDRRRALAVSEETDTLFVFGGGGIAHAIEVEDGPVAARFALGGAVIAVAHRYGDALRLYDAADGRSLASIAVGPLALDLDVDPSGEHLALVHGGSRPRLTLIDARRRRVTATLPLPFRPDGLRFGPEGSLVIAAFDPAALHRVELAPEPTLGPSLPLRRPVVSLARSPSGRQVVLALTDLHGQGPPHRGNHFVEDQLLVVDVARWRREATHFTGRRSARQRGPGETDRGGSPMGLELEDDGTLRVVFAGTGELATYTAGRARVPRTLDLDAWPLSAPHGVATLADGTHLVASPVDGSVGALSASGELGWLAALAPSERALLREDEEALKRRVGMRTFYESTRAGLSCQSCHRHAATDGSLHNIGGGALVATLSVRGRARTPPYLRDGRYPTLGSLIEVSETLYRGYRRRAGGRRVGLEAYLASLPRELPDVALEGRDEARERRGLDVFVASGCPRCHAFPAFTNLSQHPTASLFPRFAAEHPADDLDTPSLLSVGSRAQWLVDGRAGTLREVFERHDPDGLHGDTAGLEDAELEDLVAFLESL